MQLFGSVLDKECTDIMRLCGDIIVFIFDDLSTAKRHIFKFAKRVAPIIMYTSAKGSLTAILTTSVICYNVH